MSKLLGITFHRLASANTTTTLRAVVPLKNQIVGVTLRTMGLRGIPGLKGIAPQQIGSHRDNFQVRRTDAVANATKVIEGHAIRHRAVHHFMCEAMSHHGSTTVQAESAITIVSKAPLPEPTRLSMQDSGPKALFWGKGILGMLIGHLGTVLSGVTGQVGQTTLPCYFSIHNEVGCSFKVTRVE